MTGLTLPEGAQCVQKKSVQDQARTLLDKLVSNGKRVARIGRIEVYLWMQADEGVQAQMDKALQQHSDTYKKLPPAELNGALLTSFLAAFKARKTACLGLWITRRQQRLLALGEILSADPAGSAQPTGGEANGNTAPAHRELIFPRLKRTPGVIQGVVLDRNGKPMPDVTITVWFTFPGIYLHHTDILKTTTDARGRYAVDVKETLAVGHVGATCNIRYNGGNCKMPFDRRDAAGRQRINDVVSRAEGDVVNFTPAISGLRGGDEDPDNFTSYYGGMIEVRSDVIRTRGHALAPGTKIHLVLTPKGPLLDGSAGRPMAIDIPVNYSIIHPYRWKDIPIGVYLVAATLIQPNGAALPLEATASFAFHGDPLHMDANTPLYFPSDGVNGYGTGSFQFVNLELLIP